MQRCLNGDADAFGHLVERHWGSVYAVVYGNTPMRADAEDVAQEAFLRAYRKLAMLRAPDQFGPWIRRIAANLAHSWTRIHRRESVMDTATVFAERADPVIDQEREDIRRDATHMLSRAVASLPELLRVPLTMRYLADASYEEIAETLAIGPEAAKKRVRRALIQLRVTLERRGEADEARELPYELALLLPTSAEHLARIAEAARLLPTPAPDKRATVPYGLATIATAGIVASLATGFLAATAFSTSGGLGEAPYGSIPEIAVESLYYVPTETPADEPGSSLLADPGVGNLSAGALGGGAIVTVRTVGRNADIVVMDADGANPRELTSGPASDSEPAWSADGRTVYFTSNRGRLPDPADPKTEQTDIWAIDADGANPRRLTGGVGANVMAAPSPDGSLVAFVSMRTGYGKLFTVNPDGSDPRQLTFGPSWDIAPVWSPDGSRIAYQSAGDALSATTPYDIWLVDADGSNARNLTNTPWNDHGPVWTPDGEQLVFWSYRDRDDEVYIMNADGTNHRRLTHSPGQDANPRMSPDGSKILFTSSRDGVSAVYRMNLDGSRQERVSRGTASYGYASWRPAPSAATDALVSAGR